jgi:hypothetical protein
MNTTKLRVIQDYEKLSKELKEQIKLVYPEGYSDFLINFTTAKGEFVSALPFETFDKIYMVRMSRTLAEEIIEEDEDFNNKGVLKSDVRDEYEEKHSEVEYLSENENYEE